MLAEAAGQGAKVAVLPENFAGLATGRCVAAVSRRPGRNRHPPFPGEGPAKQTLDCRRPLPLANRPDGSDIPDRVRASCLVMTARATVARYDKIHLFDAMVDDAHGRRVDSFERAVVTVDTPAGSCWQSATTCASRAVPGATGARGGLGVPAQRLHLANGDAHWHALIRARAIEAKAHGWFAVGQGGQNNERRKTYGHL